MRTRAIIVAAGGALALAAGVVVPASAVPEPAGEVSTATSTASSTATSAGAFAWPTHCLDAIPDSPEDYQDVFDHRRSGWAGADGAWPIALPDGRALWLFGDSFMGDIDENDALLPGWHFVRSVQVQDGACFTPMTRGTIDAPTSFFPDQDGTVFWPSGGYVDTSVSPAVLRVVSTGICIEPPDWRMCTIKIHTLSLTDFEVLSVESVPFEPAALDMPNFGAWFFQDGGEIYLYGKAGGFQRGGPTVGGPYPAGTYVARVPAGQIGDPAAWRYWAGGAGWSASVAAAVAVEIDDPQNPQELSMGGIVPWGDGYLMTGKKGPLWVYGSQVYAWQADSPTGPWSIVTQGGQPVNVVPPDLTFPQTRMFYGGFMVTNVPGTSPTDPMLVFSTNGVGCVPDEGIPCTPDNDVAKNVMLYGPQLMTPVNLPAAGE